MTESRPPAPSQRRRSQGTLSWGLGLGLILLIGAGALWVLRPQPSKTPYRLASIELGDVTKSVSASGSLQALVTVTVGSQISGLVSKVRVDFNDTVEAGQVLAEIDPQTYESRLRQGQAALATSEAGLNEAQAQVSVARANLNRTRALFNQGITAQAALDADAAAEAAAVARVASARAGIAQAKAALLGNHVDLTRTKIVSPIKGIVINRKVDAGQTVAASLQAPELFVIAEDLSKLQVMINVDEADIGQVHEGQTVNFTVDAFPDARFSATVTQVRKQPNSVGNVVAYVVMARAGNPDGRLMPGMTANADIVIDQHRSVLKVPVAALRWTPPLSAAVTSNQPSGFGAGSGGSGGRASSGGGGGMRLLSQLDLNPDQMRKAQAILSEARAKAGPQGSGDSQQRRAVMQAGFAAIEPLLTPAQRQRLVALRAQYAADRGGRSKFSSGAVWVLRDNKPIAVPVRVGVSDGTYSEILGSLKAGDQVIIGGGPKPKAKAGSPLASPPVRVRM